MLVAPYLFESPRLGFREFKPEDSADLYRLNSDPEVMRYTGDPPFESRQDAHVFVLGYDKYKIDGFGRWAAIDKTNGEFLGWSGLSRVGDDIDLGYRFFRSAWGKGYATESAQASIEYGFRHLGLTRIIGRALEDNIASWKVLEKAGMQFTGYGNCKGLEGARIYEIFQPGSETVNQPDSH